MALWTPPARHHGLCSGACPVFNSKQSVIELPFELLHGTIIVPATVNGAGPFWMMLDTGADPSIVELGIAKSAGLKIAASGQQGSGGGTSHNLSYETSLPVVQLGGLTATKIDALAMDLSKLSSTLGRPIGGVWATVSSRDALFRLTIRIARCGSIRTRLLVPEPRSPSLRNARHYPFDTKTTFWQLG